MHTFGPLVNVLDDQLTDHVTLTKGHGTGNDFLFLWDPQGQWEVSPAAVAALCDRRMGIGADGFIRAVKTTHSGEGVRCDHGTTWFMDYRNHNGSVSEMCGNGVRVFGSYLAAMGALDVTDEQVQAAGVPVWTRAGVKVLFPEAEHPAGVAQWRVHMGTVTRTGPASAREQPHDCAVAVAGQPDTFAGLMLSVGNPHVVVPLPESVALGELDLHTVPVVVGQAPDSANVEFVTWSVGADGRGQVTLRVHERGAGETLSCGTGACAAAYAARLWAGAGAPDRWQVAVPGGVLQVEFAGDVAWLSGPAVLVAQVVIPRHALNER